MTDARQHGAAGPPPYAKNILALRRAARRPLPDAPRFVRLVKTAAPGRRIEALAFDGLNAVQAARFIVAEFGVAAGALFATDVTAGPHPMRGGIAPKVGLGVGVPGGKRGGRLIAFVTDGFSSFELNLALMLLAGEGDAA